MLASKEIHDPTVSIIMPVYNTASYLRQSIESVLAQNFKDYELIIIDDGSTDCSHSIAQDYVSIDERIIYIFQKNQGLSSARNAGLSLARGKYVLFLDSDDYLHPSTLSTCLDFATRSNADLVAYSGSNFREGALKTVLPSMQFQKPDVFTPIPGEKLLSTLFEANSYSPSACLYLASRDLIRMNNLAFEEGYIHEDISFSMHLYCYAKSAISTSSIFLNRRIHDSSITGSPKEISNAIGLSRAAYSLEKLKTANKTLHPTTIKIIKIYQRNLLRGAVNIALDMGFQDKLLLDIKKNFSASSLIRIDWIAIFYIYLIKPFSIIRNYKRRYSYH